MGDREKRDEEIYEGGSKGGYRGGVGFTTKNYKYGCGANYMRIS